MTDEKPSCPKAGRVRKQVTKKRRNEDESETKVSRVRKADTKKTQNAAEYEEKKRYAAQKSRDLSTAGRDIGPIPPVVNPERREACRLNLRLYLETYYPHAFTDPWSDDQLVYIGRLQQAIVEGGRVAIALPRGRGKTTIAERAALWAISFGHRRFVPILAARESLSKKIASHLKREVETNPLLGEDFPEVCFPVRALGGIHHRAPGQTCEGARTQITWKGEELVFPTVPDAASSGAIVAAHGITGAIRGLTHLTEDGHVLRPDFAIIDDPQTRESAGSPLQCQDRLEIIHGDVLGLAGHKRSLSVVMPLTVIHRGDLADEILDRDRHPDWGGIRRKMLRTDPTNTKAWERYAELRTESLLRHHDIREATAFYIENREVMDAGASVDWEPGHPSEYHSTVQYAMDWKIRDPVAFAAEGQNEPLADQHDQEDSESLKPEQIIALVSGYARGAVPRKAEYVTAFVDMHASILWWAVCGWAPGFSGWVLDYGAWPEQGRIYFSQADARRTLQKAAPGRGPEGAVRFGLDELAKRILAPSWGREDGVNLSVGRGLVDAGWKADITFDFCRSSGHRAILCPSYGRAIGPASIPMSDYQKRPGEQPGWHWYLTRGKAGARTIRHAVVDVNFWKSFIHARLATPRGDNGSLLLPGTEPREHQMIAEHLTAEYRVRTAGPRGTVDVWKLRPGRADNHLLDCLVGCAVGASMLGAKLEAAGTVRTVKARPQRVKLSELQARKAAAGR